MKLWTKVPVLIRAIILGFIVSSIGVISWPVLGVLLPMPWSFILMLGLLWGYWEYFSGRWWPANTQAFRETQFRRKKLSRKTWIWGLAAALLIVLIEQSALVVTFRLMEFPAERFKAAYSFLETIPVWAAWLAVIMIALVAGICEETGFRGYMQTPLERKYGPLAAIAIVSVVFVLVHLHQAWSGPILLHIFFISVLFGAIAYYSDSLIPGIIAHVVLDIFNFSFWWSDLGGQFDEKTIGDTGIDAHFTLWTFLFVLGTMAFVWIMPKLRTTWDSGDVIS